MTSGNSETDGTVIVTGGAGFIGSAVIRHGIVNENVTIVNVDKLTYAGNLDALMSVSAHANYHFEQVDICAPSAVRALFETYRPDAVMHLAAESHVDRSIDAPDDFIDTNVVGTYRLLQEARRYWSSLSTENKQKFRFQHISTDEVYGSLGPTGAFTETSNYQPNSPYSATKAAADHLVRAWHHTFDLPVVTTNCSNNYGSYQFPEKLIPLMILNAVNGKPLPIYGKGENVRDWLFVDDHARALWRVLKSGQPGETYNIGGSNTLTNIEVVNTVCAILDDLLPDSPHRPHKNLIEYVADRPGHDYRYAIDATKIETQLGWRALETFQSGIRLTVQWYLDNIAWCESVQGQAHAQQRKGLGKAS